MKLLLNVFRFFFGCLHCHLRRVFTIKHRTYKVCFDCGREFDLPDPQEAAITKTLSSARLGRNAHHAR